MKNRIHTAAYTASHGLHRGIDQLQSHDQAEQREADVPFRHGNIKNQAEYHDQYSGNTVDLDISLLDHADYDPCPGVPKAATKSLSGMLIIRVFVSG